MKGLILAGGSGMRLRPLTHTGPKQLIPIANKPALFYGVEDLREAGIKEIGVILGLNMPEMIEEALGDGSAFDTKITYVPQGEPKGLAHAVLVSKEYMGDESFVMYLGDNLLKAGVTEFVNNFEDSKFDARILLVKIKNPQQFGVAELDGSGKVIRLEEKPKKPKSDLALVGVYLFKSSIFKAVSEIKPSWRNELEITDAIQWLIDNGYNVDSHIVEGWWKDTGKPKDLLDANRLVLDGLEPSNHGKIEENVQIHGRVSIGEGTVVRDGSVIKGPSIIGKNCVIGPKTYVGAYTSIGDNTTIEETEIEDSIVIGDSRIKTGLKITESLIGRESEISEGTGTPRGARLIIGEHSDLCL